MRLFSNKKNLIFKALMTKLTLHYTNSIFRHRRPARKRLYTVLSQLLFRAIWIDLIEKIYLTIKNRCDLPLPILPLASSSRIPEI